MQTSGTARSARLGRRVGILAFAIPVAGITALWSSQIIRHVWFPEVASVAGRCLDRVQGLYGAVDRARRAARVAGAGERAALGGFRSALLPEWSERPAADELCRGDARAEQAIRELDALRYAEEHAVRYEAVGPGAERRRAEAVVTRFLRTPPHE